MSSRISTTTLGKIPGKYVVKGAPDSRDLWDLLSKTVTSTISTFYQKKKGKKDPSEK